MIVHLLVFLLRRAILKHDWSTNYKYASKRDLKILLFSKRVPLKLEIYKTIDLICSVQRQLATDCCEPLIPTNTLNPLEVENTSRSTSLKDST